MNTTMLARFVRFCEGMLGRPLTLEHITERTLVSIEAEVMTPPTVASPVSPIRASLIDWCLFDRTVIQDQQGPADNDRYDRLAGGRLGQLLILGTPHGTVLVPVENAVFVPHTPLHRNAMPIQEIPGSPVAEAIEAVHDERRPGAELDYGERYLTRGDHVSLRAEVEPLGQGGTSGPYRGATTAADFVAIADHRPPRIREVV